MVRIHPCPLPNAGVAQLVEQHLDMVEVVGSSPILRIPPEGKRGAWFNTMRPFFCLPCRGLSARIALVEKKITSFRCPVDYLEEVEELCRRNRMDRSTFITMAIRQLINSMAAAGTISALTPVDIPPPPAPVRRGSASRK